VNARPLADLSRLSLNQITVDQLTLPEAIELSVDAGIEWIGPWREKVAEIGLDESARLLREAGLRVSSLCRGGFFPAASAAERRGRDADNRRAVEEAAALGADVLVIVSGPAPDRDLRAARRMVVDGVDRLVPHAAECGVRLGIEPLHPMMAAERSVVVTLREAIALAERFDPSQVGIVVDAYHVWWDPDLETELARCYGLIAGYHVSDWLVPTIDLLAGRGLMGDGVIDLRRIRGLIEAAGYAGPIEVEVISSALRRVPAHELVRAIRERYLACV
jgi:sugar phosphate isomerase/epimerase